MKELSKNEMEEFINLLDAVAVLDSLGRYVYVSPGWIKYSGHCYEDIIHKKVWDLFPDTHAKEVYATKKMVFAKSVNFNGNPALTTYYPILNSEGSVENIYLYIIVQGAHNLMNLSQRINVLANELSYYKSELIKERSAKYGLENIIGNSPSVQKLKEEIRQAARSNSTVLIEGETGTGKELIAHSIHTLSSRNEHHFVRVNCSAIPQELMESEFFGYASGAFTGASRHGKVGKFEFADHGSIFLDEINLLPKAMQPKFLRVLQEREIEPVGSDKNISIDVRIIAATNRPLDIDVKEGTFRQDLYYRLNVIRIIAPPLRERITDIPLLVDYFIQKFNRQLGMAVSGISPKALSMLMGYHWPGNIRELQNAVESAMNICNDSILDVPDFYNLKHSLVSSSGSAHFSQTGAFNLAQAKQQLEKKLIAEALLHTGNNKASAAKLLGISRTMLYNKMIIYHIS